MSTANQIDLPNIITTSLEVFEGYVKLACGRLEWNCSELAVNSCRFFSGISAGELDFSRDGQWLTYVSYPGSIPPSAIISNLVQFFRKASTSLPVGPLRCFEIMISALPCKSGSSCR